MMCPKCHLHVTPLTVWIQESLDDPRDCPHCRQRLLPTRRMLWWSPVFLGVTLVGGVWALVVDMQVVARGLGPWAVILARIAMGAVVCLLLTLAYWMVWVSGTYRPDDSDPAGGNAAGLSLAAFDLQQLLRAAAAAEKAGDWPRAIEKYEVIAEYAGGSHPNAELARQRVRELRGRLDESAGPPRGE